MLMECISSLNMIQFSEQIETILDIPNKKVDAIDDNEELEYTEDAFNVLGFSTEVKKIFETKMV